MYIYINLNIIDFPCTSHQNPIRNQAAEGAIAAAMAAGQAPDGRSSIHSG